MVSLSHMISVGCEDTAIPFNGPMEVQSATSTTLATTRFHRARIPRRISIQTNLLPVDIPH